MLWRIRERSRTASRPKTRAVPREGSWNPSSVLINVDLPAPLGPSRPMALPRSSPLSPSRTTRPPSRTSNRSRSIVGVPNNRSGVPTNWSWFVGWRSWSLGCLFTPMSLPYEVVPRLVPEQRAEGKKIKTEKPAVAFDFNAALPAECTDRGGPGVGRQLADGIGRFAAELLQDRVEHRAQVLVGHRRIILVLILRKQRAECGRAPQRAAVVVSFQGI